ncbi:Hypothetical protein PBC10988_30090 [Planctomycetales bacterium 10988]|nr:Hypothetical protein PBC10988_30090 [Planctomycetales bacterium 10988]
MSKTTSLRRAALLVQSLDEETAAALLQCLTPQEQTEIQQAVDGLSSMDADEQAAIWSDFLAQASAPEQDAGAKSDANSTFWNSLDDTTWLRLLKGEKYSSIALVLYHVPSEQSCRVLDQLPTEQQTAVLQHLPNAAKVHADIVLDFIEMLRERLAQLPPLSNSPATESTVPDASTSSQPSREVRQKPFVGQQGIHSAMESSTTENPVVVTASKAKLQSATRLEELSDGVLRETLDQADPQMVVLALSGSSQELTRRVMRLLPHREARSLRRAMANLGTVRMSDLLVSQEALLKLAMQRAAGTNTPSPFATMPGVGSFLASPSPLKEPTWRK